jgi:hypothetical protein
MNLIQRVSNISLNPKTEWEVIAPEASSTGSLYRDYIAPLAAIGPVSSFIGLSVIGMGIPFLGSYRMPMLAGLSSMLVQYAFALIGIYLVALLIDALAPTFGAEKNQLQALKLAAYAATPAWIGGALSLLPGLALLSILATVLQSLPAVPGLAPVMMRTPKDKPSGLHRGDRHLHGSDRNRLGRGGQAVGGAASRWPASAMAPRQDARRGPDHGSGRQEYRGDTRRRENRRHTAGAGTGEGGGGRNPAAVDGQARFEVVDQGS